MKYPRILSLTMANGLGFLIFGSILAGCQKTAIPKKGFITHVAKQLERSPASHQKDFQSYQDPKQIFIYCQLNDLNPSSCYQRHLEESARQFVRKNSLSDSNIKKILNNHTYQSADKQLQTAMRKIFMALQPSINQVVAKRSQFCAQNAKLYMERCLKQYLKKETFHVLNKYQSANNSMNGHEYLYLKNKIERKIAGKLDFELAELEKTQKKKL